MLRLREEVRDGAGNRHPRRGAELLDGAGRRGQAATERALRVRGAYQLATEARQRRAASCACRTSAAGTLPFCS